MDKYKIFEKVKLKKKAKNNVDSQIRQYIYGPATAKKLYYDENLNELREIKLYTIN